MGEHIELACKRLRLSAFQVPERADITLLTLNLIEKGNSSVSFGANFNVLRVPGLQNAILKLAADDEFGRITGPKPIIIKMAANKTDIYAYAHWNGMQEPEKI